MITQAELKAITKYNPETGVFTRTVKASNQPVGSEMGNLNADGYHHMRVNGKTYKRSRLAWLYMTGEMPAELIDHKDRVRNNDIWDNLRAASSSENAVNTTPRDPKRKVGVKKHLGYFDEYDDAVDARKAAE